MKVVDIATEFFKTFGEPSDSPIPVIAYWIRNNIGQLNSAINTRFYINTTTLEINEADSQDSSVVTEIGIEEKDVLKAIFQVYLMDKEIRKNIMTYTTAPVIEIQEDGYSVRMASATEVGRNLYTFRKAVADALKDAITAYKTNKATPRQVVGDDTVPGNDCDANGIFRRVAWCL